jgi:hypothetical protein
MTPFKSRAGTIIELVKTGVMPQGSRKMILKYQFFF